MPDIFDDIAPEKVVAGTDIFDEVSPEPSATVGKPRALWNSLVRGIKTAQALPDVAIATGTADMAKPSIRQERKAYVASMSDPQYQQKLMEAGDDRQKLRMVEETRGPGANLEKVMQPARSLQTESVRDLAAAQADIQAIPMSPAQQRLAMAKTSDEKWGVWLKDPVELTAGIVLESLPPSIAGSTLGTAIGGPGIGTAAGAGASSAAMTFASEFLGAASQQGVDITNPESLESFLNNKKMFSGAFNTALTKAAIVGGVDAGTAGMAGTWMEPALKQGLKQRIVASGKELAMQMSAGAGGEAAGQIVSGQPIDLFDIAMEALAEVASAPGEVAGNLMAKNHAAANTMPTPARPASVTPARGDVFDQVSTETQPQSPETASNSRPPAAVATPAPAGASPGDALTQEIAGNVVPPSAKRVDDATGKPLDKTPATKADLKALADFIEKGGPNPFATKVEPKPTNSQSNESNPQANPANAAPGDGQKVATTQVLPQTPQGNASGSENISDAEKAELQALRSKDKIELLEGPEEQRMYELSRKENATKRRIKTASEVTSLKEAGITVDDSFLNPEPGTETHITGWTKDKNGFIQIRTETHKNGSLTTRLTTLKSGDTLSAGMDDSKEGTSRYAESISADRPGGETVTAAGGVQSTLPPATQPLTQPPQGAKTVSAAPGTSTVRSGESNPTNERQRGRVPGNPGMTTEEWRNEQNKKTATSDAAAGTGQEVAQTKVSPQTPEALPFRRRTSEGYLVGLTQGGKETKTELYPTSDDADKAMAPTAKSEPYDPYKLAEEHNARVRAEEGKSETPSEPETVADVLRIHDEGGEDISTARDVAEKVQELIDQGKAPKSLQKHITKFNKAVDESRQEYGERMGVEEEAADAMMTALAEHVRKIDKTAPAAESKASDERPVSQRERSVKPTDVERPDGSRGAAGATSDRQSGSDESRPGESVASGRQPDTASDRDAGPGGRSPSSVSAGEAEQPDDASVSAARGKRDLRRAQSEPVTSPRNYVITDADQLGKGSLKTKAKDNLAAIRLVKLLESEQRQPTTAEQSKLVRYVGWGGLKGIFDQKNKTYAKEFQELRDLLTPEEYEAARASVQDAHYTSQTVIQRGIYAAMRRLGFTGGKMVEGGVGIGNFIGLMPAELRAASSYLGVERDPLTAKIAQYLYPEAKILSMGYQDAQLARDSFDGAVGNPPFGNKAIFDKNFKESSAHTIHNYFIAKTLELTRPGGVAGFVVSRYFLDTANSAAREHIATLGEFLGAIRLPNTAFKENANTEVVTDLVFFKRRAAGEDTANTDWTKVTDFKDPKSGLTWKVNKWLVEHPDMVLGEMTQAKHGLYSKEEMSVEPRPNQDLGNDLDRAVTNLPQNVYEATSRKTSERLTTPENTTTDTNGAKVGGFFVTKDGTLMKRLPDVNAEQQSAPVAEMKDGTKDRVKAIIPIRDALNQLVRAELSPDSTEKEIEGHRAALNKAYDAFNKKFGFLNSPTNRRAFYDDADSMRVLGLEREYNPGISADTAKKKGVDAIKPSAKKADIFTKRVNAPYREITQVDTPKEAMMASLNQRGGIDVDYMAEITGMDKSAVLEALDGLVFENPKGGYESKEEYLSGNVRQKFNEARDAALDDPKYQKNADALKAVIPKDIDPTDIIAPVGAPWVSAKDVEDFADELTGRPPIAVSYMKSNGGWMFNHYDGSEASTQKWGTPRLPFGDLFKLMLNGKPVVVYDSETNEKGNEVKVVNQEQTELANAKAAEIKDKWQDWLWQDKERRDRLHRVYNDNYNNYVEFRADGGHLTLPGASPLITLNPHQKNVVWRTVTAGGKGLLYDHVVGAGKTFAGVASMMELRRLGRVRKWLVTVPNHLTGQWADAFNVLYPNSNVLAAKPSDFTKENRQKLFAKILTGDFDAVVLGHTSLKKIGTSPEVEKSILKEMLDEIVQTIKEMKEAAGKGGGTRAISQMEKTKDNIQAKIAKLANIGDRDTVASFEELGFDGLFLDEAHEFKNLFYTTQMQNVAGLGNPTGSAKAFDLYLKTRFLRQQYGGRAPLVFATGTPISNSLVEMFTMQRYLQPDVLADMGLKTLDAWGKVFADVRAVYEVDPTGTGYRMATRLANFQNVGELTAIYKNMADVITMNDLQAQAEAAGKRFPVPKVEGGKPDNIVAERTPEQAEFFGIETQELDEEGNPRYDTEGNPIASYPKGTILWRVDNMPDDPREDNMLKLTNDARKAGLDMRLIDPNAPDRPSSKINKAVAEITRIYRKWDKDKGTQLVFCDLSVPSSAKGKATKKAKGGDLGYYIRNQKTGELTAVEGKPVTLENGGSYEFFIRKANSGLWMISERTSGTALQGGDTQKEAVEKANALLGRVGLERLKEEVDKYQPTADQLAELAAAKPEPEAKPDEADDNAEDTGEQGVSVDELLAEQSSFSVYDDMRDKLLKAGIPANQIAFIHDYDTPEKKMKLFKAMNAGDVRILFGSTPKLGAGTNVQKRLVALHHMDAPWRPSDLEQREGRAIRQGNQFYEEAIKGYKSPQDYDKDPKAFAVEIKRYATALTYDTRMWQLIEHKANGIEGFRRADRTTRTIEDIGGEATNASDMKAAASGDPAIQQEIQLRNERKRLELLKNAWNKNRIELQNRAAFLKDYDLRYQSAVDAAQALIEKRDKNTKRDKAGDIVFEFTLPDGKVATEKGQPVAYMADMLKDGGRGYLGKYRGFDFSFEPRKDKDAVSVTIYNGKNSFDFRNIVTAFSGDDKLTGVGLIQRLDNYLKSFETDIKQAEYRRDNEKKSLASVQEEAKKDFSKADELTRVSQEHETVKSQLINKKKKPAAAPKTDIVDKLEALKDKSPPKMMAAWIPGLDPESFRAIRNTALDIAIAAIKAGRAVREAVREAINQLKAKYQGIDEAAAIADLEAELRVNQSPSDWRTIQAQYEDAERALQSAISQHMNPPAGMKKAAARTIRNQATAKLRNLRHDLLHNPAYAEHMILRERQVWQQLKALLEPTGIKPSPDGLLGREERIREALSDVEVRRVVELNREWENVRQEIEAMPKKLVGAISNRLYPAKGTTKTDLELPSEWLQSQLGDQSPVTEPTDITTTADRVRDTVASLPDSLRDTWRASGKAVKAVWAKAQTMPNRDIVSYTKDAADNKAQILSRQAANVVLHEMNRAFGVPIDTRNAAREAALTFAIEAGDKGTLDLMRETINDSEHARTKWGREALTAIAYAEKHWDRFENVVTLYNRVTNAQAAAEQSSGIKTLTRDGGYVFHLQDVLENWAHMDMTGGTGGAASPFKNIRDYATYADSIANGLNPKTLNAVDLLQRRVSLGQKLINYRGWQESLKEIIDPATQQPLGADVVIRVRADGSETETAPVGYKLVRFAGQPYAIHRAYSGLFSALTADSGWRQGAGWHTLMKSATTAKHMMLMFDTFHLGRLAFWSSIMRGAGDGAKVLLPGNPASYRQGLTLLDSTIADLRKMAIAGELTEAQAKSLVENKATLMKLLNAGLNVGSVGDNIYADWIQKLPLVGQFNRWLFEKYQRGAMTEVALIEYQRQRADNPELSDEVVARKVAKAVNIRFGNLNSQAWIKSKHAQDLARLVFLAPQWNESLIRAEIEAVKDAGVFVKNVPQGRLKVGTLGRAVATAFIGQFIANQLINWFFRDKPTWENEEEGFEAKISAYVPDYLGNSKGCFLNPMTLPAEITHLILKGHARTGRWDQALVEAMKSRFSSFGRFADVFVEGKNGQGERATGLGDRLALAAGDSVPLPIGANAPARMIASKISGENKEQYPGQFQRQVMQTFGVKPDSVPSAEQRIRRLAREYNASKGKPDNIEFAKSDYADLDNAIRVGNNSKARQELALLLQNHDSEAILRRYEARINGRFTGSAEREPGFLKTLNPEQRKQYEAALIERRQMFQEIKKLINEASATARK